MENTVLLTRRRLLQQRLLGRSSHSPLVAHDAAVLLSTPVPQGTPVQVTPVQGLRVPDDGSRTLPDAAQDPQRHPEAAPPKSGSPSARPQPRDGLTRVQQRSKSHAPLQGVLRVDSSSAHHQRHRLEHITQVPPDGSKEYDGRVLNATMRLRLGRLLTRVSASLLLALNSSSVAPLEAIGSALSELWIEQPQHAALWPCAGQGPDWLAASHPSLVKLLSALDARPTTLAAAARSNASSAIAGASHIWQDTGGGAGDGDGAAGHAAWAERPPPAALLQMMHQGDAEQASAGAPFDGVVDPSAAAFVLDGGSGDSAATMTDGGSSTFPLAGGGGGGGGGGDGGGDGLGGGALTAIETRRLRRKLQRLSAVDAALPLGFELHAARCPAPSQLLDFLNRSMPEAERPRVVVDVSASGGGGGGGGGGGHGEGDGGDRGGGRRLGGGGPSAADIPRLDLLDVSSGEVASSAREIALFNGGSGSGSGGGGSGGRRTWRGGDGTQARGAMLLVEAAAGRHRNRGLRAPAAKGTLALWWWWWGPWWWWWRWWFWWWRPPKLRLSISVDGGRSLPDNPYGRIFEGDKKTICVDVNDHWFVLPMVVQVWPMEGNQPGCKFSRVPWAAPDASYRWGGIYAWFWYFQRRRCFSMRCDKPGSSTHLKASRLWSWYDTVTPGASGRFGVARKGRLTVQRVAWSRRSMACDAATHLPLAYEGDRAAIGANFPACDVCPDDESGPPSIIADATDADADADEADAALQRRRCSGTTANKDPVALAREAAPWCVQVGLTTPSVGETAVRLRASTSSVGASVVCSSAEKGLELPPDVCDDREWGSEWSEPLAHGSTLSEMLLCRCRPGPDGICMDVRLHAVQEKGINEYKPSEWPRAEDASLVPEVGCCRGSGAGTPSPQGMRTRAECERRCGDGCSAFASVDDSRNDASPETRRPCYTYVADAAIRGGPDAWARAIVRGGAACPNHEADLRCFKRAAPVEERRPSWWAAWKRWWDDVARR